MLDNWRNYLVPIVIVMVGTILGFVVDEAFDLSGMIKKLIPFQ